jgi:glutaminyl-tRNA synthetase
LPLCNTLPPIMAEPDNKPSTHVDTLPGASARVNNFIRHIIDADLKAGKYLSRHWSGQPGPAAQQKVGAGDTAKIRTRFPPEPNGYLHFGHAKSICLNFGLALDYAGACHLRFDDTNPEKEEQEYVDSIIDAVHWLGFSWENAGANNQYFASDYFQWMYDFAEKLIEAGHAYVDSQTADELRASRGTLTEAGKNSPFRTRTPADNLDLFRRMKAGEFADGTHVLRAKIDMGSGNINLRDPAIYRIRKATHHNTGDAWCIYPMYTYAHPIEDALENITHSICTLEFEDQRPFYDWLLARLAELGCVNTPLPQQIEFARLNLSYVVLSKRKLIQLVDEKHVDGWDDPRLPTLVGARRRGFTPEGFRRFQRNDRRHQVGFVDRHQRTGGMPARAPQRNRAAPHRRARPGQAGDRQLSRQARKRNAWPPTIRRSRNGASVRCPSPKELWIEREDFMEVPSKGYLPPLPRQHGAPALRLRRQMHRLRQGCRRQGHGRALRIHGRLEIRHARAPTTTRSRATSTGFPRTHACARRSPSV